MENEFDLTGQVAIVTGAHMGLGRAIAVGLAAVGAQVIASDILDTTDTASEIREFGGTVTEVHADVRSRADVVNLVQATADRYGKVDILVNNAAIFGTGPVEDVTDEFWDDVMAVNLKGTFMCSQEAGKHMRAAGSGKIINFASITGQVGYAGCSPYNASKAGVILFTKTLAVEWARYNINVNAVCPAYFVTKLTSDHIRDIDQEQIDKVRRHIPLGGGRDPKEIVGTVIYLASDASKYVTGQALAIDGGWTAGLL